MKSSGNEGPTREWVLAVGSVGAGRDAGGPWGGDCLMMGRRRGRQDAGGPWGAIAL